MIRHLLVTAMAGYIGALAHAQDVTKAFTYQGSLSSSGSPASGVYDFRFSLYNEAGTLIAGPLCVDDLTIANGVFAAALDFGPDAGVFDGTKRFLEIAVRPGAGWACGNATGLVILSPRQELTATPYASTAISAVTASNASSLNGQGASFYQSAANLTSGTLGAGRLSGGYPNALTLSNAGNSFTGSGTGLTGLNASNLASGTIADARIPAGIPRLAGAQTFSGINTFTANHTIFNGIAIRTLTPQAPLHVLSSPSGVSAFSPRATAIFESSQANYLQIMTPAGTERGIGFGDPDHGFKGGIFFDGGGVSAGLMNFRTGTNDTRMVIDSTGRVGIGTVTPAALLHVAGAARFDGPVTIPATTRYVTISPADLEFVSPADEALGYDRQAAGFRSLASGSTQMNLIAPVNIPHGATITEFQVFFNDTNCPTDARISFLEVPLNGTAATSLATVFTSGCNDVVLGQVQALTRVVNAQTSTYAVTVRLPASIKIIGMRITYEVTQPLP